MIFFSKVFVSTAWSYVQWLLGICLCRSSVCHSGTLQMFGCKSKMDNLPVLSRKNLLRYWTRREPTLSVHHLFHLFTVCACIYLAYHFSTKSLSSSRDSPRDSNCCWWRLTMPVIAIPIGHGQTCDWSVDQSSETERTATSDKPSLTSHPPLQSVSPDVWQKELPVNFRLSSGWP